MRFLFYLLVVIGVQALMYPLTYVFLVRWYKNNPEAEKTNSFELLDSVYRHKYAKSISVGIGIICFAAWIIIFRLYYHQLFNY